MARRTLDNSLGWTPGQLDEEWSRIATLEELIMAETMVRTRMDALLAESKVKGHRQALLANAKLTPSDLALCRQDLECMTREQIPTIGDTLKAMGSSDGDPMAMVQICQPPEHSASNDSQGAP